MYWRRKRQPTPVFLPGETQGWGSLVGCRLWGHTELDTTEVTLQRQQQAESQVALVFKNLPANAGDIRDVGSVPESGRSPGGGHGNPLCSSLENPMVGGAWWATVHGVAQNGT